MPHFVTRFSSLDAPSVRATEHDASADLRRRALRAYKRRLVELHTRAPDTLRARVRRALRAAAAARTE